MQRTIDSKDAFAQSCLPYVLTVECDRRVASFYRLYNRSARDGLVHSTYNKISSQEKGKGVRSHDFNHHINYCRLYAFSKNSAETHSVRISTTVLFHTCSETFYQIERHISRTRGFFSPINGSRIFFASRHSIQLGLMPALDSSKSTFSRYFGLRYWTLIFRIQNVRLSSFWAIQTLAVRAAWQSYFYYRDNSHSHLSANLNFALFALRKRWCWLSSSVSERSILSSSKISRILVLSFSWIF